MIMQVRWLDRLAITAATLTAHERSMTKSSTFTGLAAVLFALGLVVMFVALFHEGSPRIALVAAILFVGTFACWLRAARLEARATA
jgi:hypothetical protein